MANISVYLAKIKSAIYGEEVRGSIHDAIEAMNDESSEAKEAAITAKNSASNSASAAAASATNAANSALSAETSATNAANSAQAAATLESSASVYANNAKISETNAANSASAAATSETNAASSAQAADQSATNASNSAQAAATSETNAKNSENASKEYCDSAELSKISASESAGNALLSANNASTSADEAAESASDAGNSASDASQYMNSASLSADLAQNSASAAETATTTAAEQAGIAAAKASDAASSASAASNAADTASDAANSANEASAAASEAKDISDEFSKLTKSYAVGGTGMRENEDTDNAKYYAEQAKDIVGGDFVTNTVFDNRISDVNSALEQKADLVEGKIPLEQITVDSTLSETSENPVQNKVIGQTFQEFDDKVGRVFTSFQSDVTNRFRLKADLVEGKIPLEQITVDSALNSTSENPVQNKVINNAFDTSFERMNSLRTMIESNKVTVDSALSETSENPVQNKVVKTALDGKASNNHTHSNYAPKASPVFTDSISMGRSSGSSIGTRSVAFGQSNTASGIYSQAEGNNTYASGPYSHAEGSGTYAYSTCSHAGGNSTIAHANYQTAIGIFNVESTDENDKFIIGNGSNKGAGSGRSNCFRVSHTGVYASGNYNASGADYAEYFEWADGNPDNEDRIGLFVTLDGDKIKIATPNDDYIVGVISGAASVIGDAYDDQWNKMYLKDIFGRPVWETVEIPDETDEEGNVIIPAYITTREKLNPEYNNSREYIKRSERPEWDVVGMMGKLVVIDDGTCEVNGWAKVGESGIATYSEVRTKYRVMNRIDESHIRILIL